MVVHSIHHLQIWPEDNVEATTIQVDDGFWIELDAPGQNLLEIVIHGATQEEVEAIAAAINAPMQRIAKEAKE